MTNPSPGLPHPVRRVPPTSPNSAAITSSMLPIPMRRVIPDRRTGSELLRLLRVTDITPMQSGDCLPGFTNQFGESSSDRQAMRRVPPELSKPVRRVPPDRHAGIELLRLHRTVQTNAASYPSDCPKHSGESL